MPFIAAYFNELVSSSTLTPPPCHSARRVCPELQNPLFLKSEGKSSPSREKVFLRFLETVDSATPGKPFVQNDMRVG